MDDDDDIVDEYDDINRSGVQPERAPFSELHGKTRNCISNVVDLIFSSS
jgi:hypothetical protein